MPKVCEDCVSYLKCSKVKAEDENHEICEKFEDNFPEIEDDFEVEDEHENYDGEE